MSRPVFANINLSAIQKNYDLAQKLSSNNPPVAVVKANAYGCGMVEVAKSLAKKVKIFAVSSLEEALLLRKNNIKQPILMLEGFFEKDELEYICKYNFIPLIHNQFQLDVLENLNLQKTKQKKLEVWLKLNSGMNRLGFYAEQIDKIVEKSTGAYAPFCVKALATHFATADAKDSQVCKTAYKQAYDLALKNRLALSASNSAGILAFDFKQDFTRPGIMLYGASPLNYTNSNSKKICEVVQLKSKILAIHNLEEGEALGYGQDFVAQKPTKVATIAGGYGDGFSRERYKAPVYFSGHKCPIVGRISMDMMSIDISSVENAQVGNEVEFFGENLKIEEVAKINSTISYTLITQLMQRVERNYFEN